MTRRFRLALIFLLVVAGTAATLVGCARYYLTSSRASNQIAEKLQDVLGAPVRISEVDVGLRGDSSLTRVEVFEADGARPETPWLTVQDIRADLSALDVVSGNSSPNRVVMSGVKFELRFDADGHLLTRLPRIKPTGRAYPQLVLEGGELTLAQEGRPPLVVHGLNAEAGDKDGDLEFHGKVSDPYWGDWTVEGAFKSSNGNMSLHLKAPPMRVTQEKLEELPFVSANVWKHVKFNGTTPVDLALTFTVGQAGAHYRVELEPTDTVVTVTSIDLTAEKASGKVIVEDRHVQLRDVKGQSAEGLIDLPKADLDFRKDVYALAFDVGVKKVNVRKLPASWKIQIPEKYKDQRFTATGRMENFTVAISDGKPHMSGAGSGSIDTLLGGVLPLHIEITLEAQGDHFVWPDLTKKSASMGTGQRSVPVAARIEQEDAVGEPPAGPHTLAAPVGQATQGLRSATGGIARLGTKAMAQVDRWAKGLPPGEKTTYIEAKTSLKDVDLEQLFTALDVKPPFPVSGRITVTLQIALPIDTPGDYKAYKARGDATLPRLNIVGVEMKDVVAKVSYADGLLTLNELRGRFPDSGGDFAGDGKVQLFPAGDLTVKMEFEKVPLDHVLALLPGAEGKAEGGLSGRGIAQAPANKLRDPKAWEAAGSLRSDRLVALGLALTDASVSLTVKNGVAKASDLSAKLEGGPVTGDAEVSLGDGYPFKGKLELKDTDLAALQRLSEGLRPPFAVKGRAGVVADLQGKLTPLSVTASGTAQAKDLTVADVLVDSLTFKWGQEVDRIKLRDLTAKLYEGSVTGAATVPLKDTVAGDADLKIADVDVQKLAKASGVVPFKIEGRVSGTVSGTLAAVVPNKGRELTSKIELSAPKMRVQGVATQKVHGNINYRAGGGDYKLEGEALGGKFELEGKLPPPKEAPPPKEPEGRLRLQGMRLSRLGEALGMPGALAPLAGRLDLDLPFRYEGVDHRPVGNGTLHIRNVRWASSEVVDALRAEVRLTANALQVRDISGNLGEGSVRGTINLNLKDVERSWFNLQLERIDAERVLGPFLTGSAPSPTSRAVGATSSPIQGALEIQLRGHLGNEWRATGHVALTRGKVFGADVSEWRLPLTLAYAPSQGTGQLDFSDNNAQLAHGRVQGRASLRWGSGLHLEGVLRFFDVDVPTLLRSTGEASKIAGGRATGRLDFGGENIRSTDDLTATLDASFTQAQPLQLPVLEVIVPYVAPGQSAMTFQKGDVRANLSRGVVRVKRLAMSNSSVQMLVEGTLNLTGRVDLDVTASTGTLGLSTAALGLTGLRVPATGAIPLATLTQASVLLSSRVIHLRVTGTVKNPNVQIDTVRLLTEEAVRFFAGAAVGVPLP